MSILIIRNFPHELKRQMELRARTLGLPLDVFAARMLDETFTAFETKLVEARMAEFPGGVMRPGQIQEQSEELQVQVRRPKSV